MLVGVPVCLIGSQNCATLQLLLGRFVLKDYLRPKA